MRSCQSFDFQILESELQIFEFHNPKSGILDFWIIWIYNLALFYRRYSIDSYTPISSKPVSTDQSSLFKFVFNNLIR